MTETYMVIVKPTPWTWDGLTPLTAGEASNLTSTRTHPRRESCTGYVSRVVTDRSDWVPGEDDPEHITMRAWTYVECVSAPGRLPRISEHVTEALVELAARRALYHPEATR